MKCFKKCLIRRFDRFKPLCGCLYERKKSFFKQLNKALQLVLFFCLYGVAQSQIPVTLTDVGSANPTPGPNDISQLSIAGYDTAPDGLNYYINNSPACGQTFTTGSSPAGYQLNSLSLRTAGDGGGMITATPQSYHLWIYSISGNHATLVGSYVSKGGFVFSENDWLQWTGLSLPLLPNSVYAYAIRNTVTSSWESLNNASGNPYTAGELVLIPTGGGTITFGGSHGYDAAFIAGLSVPVSADHAVWETLVDSASFNDVTAFTNKWGYNYPWGTDHNGSARMNQTNVSVSDGVVTLTSLPTNGHEGTSQAPPHLTIRYNSGTFYLKQQISINQQFPIWDISGQFKVPTQIGTWPAFWMTGVNSWPPESDFMEFKGSPGCNQNTYDGSWRGKITKVLEAGSDWHTYRLVATLVDSKNVDFRYYIDGLMETEQTATTFVGSPCWLIIDYQMEGSSGSPGPNSTTYFYMTNIVVRRENVSRVASGIVNHGIRKMLAQIIRP
jgi:hypothetical protein